MAILPLIVGLNNIFGIQGMINLKMDKQFMILTFIGALISIVLNFILVPIYFENWYCDFMADCRNIYKYFVLFCFT